MRNEAELRDVTQRMAAAQRLAHFGNWEWDVTADRVTWSAEMHRIFGVSPDDFGATYDAFLQLVHPHDRRRVAEQVQSAIARVRPFVFEHRILVDGDTSRTLRCHGEPVTDADGRVVRMFGVCQDITKLAESERGRRSAEDRFRNAFENAPIGVALVAIA